VRAWRRTSTALRRAISNSRGASRRSPMRGRASASLPSAARAVSAASRASSLPRKRRLPRGVRLTSSTVSRRPGEEAGKPGAVAAAALDRPGAATRRMPLSDAKQLAVAAPVRGCRRPSHDSARRRRHDRDHMLVAVPVDAEHVVQLVCKHRTDPPSPLGGPGAGLSAGKPRPQDGDESRPRGRTSSR
jgi:hypothetical protein